MFFMNDINVIIAEYCGWKNIKEIDYQPIGTDPYIDGPDQMWVGIHPESDCDEYEPLPDYCNDLNAIHEAECKLSNSLKWDHLANLHKIMKTYHTAELYFAPVKQRAEAFVKTIGKWN